MAEDVADNRKLIAIVEDDPHLVEMFQDVLSLFARWKLHIFADGQLAKDQLPGLGAHLILLDVGLPNLDGVSLYKILRGHNSTRHTPIVIITGSHDWELQRMGLKTGFLLRKPFHMQELITIIEALLLPEREG